MSVDLYARLDVVMANLKQVEPSPSFELAFRARLAEAAAVRQAASPAALFAERVAAGLERVRRVLFPEMPVMARAFGSLAVTVFLGVAIYALQPQLPQAALSSDATVTDPSGRTYTTSTFVRPIRAGDIVRAGPAAPVDVTCSGRYAVRVKPGSAVRFVRFTPNLGPGEMRFLLERGEAMVSIDESFKGSRLIVETKEATAMALGTKFSVSVDSAARKTKVSVAEGKVRVSGATTGRERVRLAESAVVVEAGQKSVVAFGSAPGQPQRLIDEEWEQLDELYQIGRRAQVVLLVKLTPDRVLELLRPCPLYIYDEKPRVTPRELENAVEQIGRAVKSGDAKEHVAAVRALEKMVAEHPNKAYDVQFLLYIGSYYRYLGRYDDSIRVFRRVVDKYPHSPLASMAQCAIGAVYEYDVKDAKAAEEAYRSVLQKYPNSIESIWIRKKIEESRKNVST